MNLCIVIVAYEAALTITDVLDRMPSKVHGEAPTVLVSDDHSTDSTVAVVERWCETSDLDVRVVVQPHNRGYGGNQKAGYAWARDHGYDVVALVHGDAQYPPELVEELTAPIHDGTADMVFGSRMITRGGARAGGMPWVRLVGNRALSVSLNRLSGASLSEWFSGFRAYRVDALTTAGFEDLPDGFDFDTEITLRFLRSGGRVAEIEIPTRYAGEICRVPLMRTGLWAIRHGAAYRKKSG